MILTDGGNELLFSSASAYELALKVRSGKLTLPDPPESYVPERLIANGFTGLPVVLAHALRAGSLPWIHRDPLDRLLIAQAQIEGIAILTADPAISRYDVETIW